jgi:hypothetical protein
MTYNMIKNQILLHQTLHYNQVTSRKPPFCNYVFNFCSTTIQIKNYTYDCNLFFCNWETFFATTNL